MITDACSVQSECPQWRPLRVRLVPPIVEWFSCKLRRMVRFESELESDLGILVETDPNVVFFCEQAALASAVISGEPKTSILDLGVFMVDGTTCYCEAKYESAIYGPKVKPRIVQQLEIQRRWAAREGKISSVLTEKIIRARPNHLRNCKHLLTGMRAAWPTRRGEIDGALLDSIENEGPISYELLRRRIGPVPQSEVLPALAHLIFSGVLAADLDSGPFCGASKIWRHHAHLSQHPNAGEYRS